MWCDGTLFSKPLSFASVFRASRPLTVALLWLAIALLPLRGWAASGTLMALPGGQVAMQAAGDTQATDGTPCHGADHAGETGAAAKPACSLCDVCHSAFVAQPAMQAALPVLPRARPRAALVPPVEHAALAGPERPPRIVLA